MQSVYDEICNAKREGRKLLAVLVDPDKCIEENVRNCFVEVVKEANPDYIFVGGSLLTCNCDDLVVYIKQHTSIPIVLFPGSVMQLSKHVDAMLFLNLISGRNPEYLIGQHVTAAMQIKQSKVECISTGYILIDGGKKTSVEYISNTTPIPSDKVDIVVATAVAGEMLGNKLVYLEAGSGAKNSVSEDVIRGVKKNISIPIIVGGGLKTSENIKRTFEAGADVVVVGTAIENNPELLKDLK